MKSFYSDLPARAFWKTGVQDTVPQDMTDIYTRKWEIAQDARIAAAGSCFARHLTGFLVRNGFNVLTTEVAPKDMPAAEAAAEGYGQFSARYGNIYTVAQLVQLAQEVLCDTPPDGIVWRRGDRFVDALRPRIPHNGYATAQAVLDARAEHRTAVREMFCGLDIFVFTLGLTEAWVGRTTGTVYPTAPGTVAQCEDADEIVFHNYSYGEVHDGLTQFFDLLRQIRGAQTPEFKVLLTVSPVPLTATATGKHILPASSYSKSTLRAAAGDIASSHAFVDYFPSYEIVTNPAARSVFFDDNLRTVKEEGVVSVMRVFFHHHRGDDAEMASAAGEKAGIDADCEDALLESFAATPAAPAQITKGAGEGIATAERPILFWGNSHLAGFKGAVMATYPQLDTRYAWFVPTNWIKAPPKRSAIQRMRGASAFDRMEFLPEYSKYVQDMDLSAYHGTVTLCIVGERLLGDHIMRANGQMKAGYPGLEDGRAISPDMPIIESVDQARVDFYTRTMVASMAPTTKLLDDPMVRRAVWVAAPDMVERVGRFRFGDEFVDGGSYVHHKDAAIRAAQAALSKQKNLQLVLHDLALSGPSGFTLDKWAANDRPWDIHTRHGYYRDAVNRIFT